MSDHDLFCAVRDNYLYLRPVNEVLEKYGLTSSDFFRTLKVFDRDYLRRKDTTVYSEFGKPYPDFSRWKECTDTVSEAENFYVDPEIFSKQFGLPYWVVRYQQERFRFVRGKLEGMLDFYFEKFHNRQKKFKVKRGSSVSSSDRSGRSLYDEYSKYQRDGRIKVVITKSSRIISKWIQRYIFDPNVGEVGMDTEYDFEKMIDFSLSSPTFFPDVVQIATTKSCLLIQTVEGEVYPPKELQQVIKNHRIKKWFCHPENDAAKIFNWFQRHGITFKKPHIRAMEMNAFRAKKFCQKFGFMDLDQDKFGGKVSLAQHCLDDLGRRLEKPQEVTLSRWSKKYLSQRQIDYAVNDAVVCLEIIRRRREIDKDPGLTSVRQEDLGREGVSSNPISIQIKDPNAGIDKTKTGYLDELEGETTDDDDDESDSDIDMAGLC